MHAREQTLASLIASRCLVAGRLMLLLLAGCSAPNRSDLFARRASVPALASETVTSAGSAGNPAAAALANLPSSGDASGGEGQNDDQLGLVGGSGGSDLRGVGSSAAGAAVSDAGDRDAEPPDARALACVSTAEVCDGLDNDCDGDVDPGATCAVSCAGFALQGRGYMFCSDSVVRTKALERCAAEGMRLAWLETADESEAVRGQIVATGRATPVGSAALLVQIGGSDAANEGTWLWVGNDAAPNGFQFWSGGAASGGNGQLIGDAYVAWSDGEPSAIDQDEDCAAMLVMGGDQRAPGQWDDRSCSELLPFVCEAP